MIPELLQINRRVAEERIGRVLPGRNPVAVGMRRRRWVEFAFPARLPLCSFGQTFYGWGGDWRRPVLEPAAQGQRQRLDRDLERQKRLANQVLPAAQRGLGPGVKVAVPRDEDHRRRLPTHRLAN